MAGISLTDETGQEWHVYPGDAGYELWEQHDWLPLDIVVPRRLIAPDLPPTHIKYEQPHILYTDAMNDKKMKDAVHAAIFERILHGFD
jgi:hypothetical protein